VVDVAPDPALIADVADLLARSQSALFITGAGLSADSGLPTYRGIGGLYDREMTEEGLPIEVALSGEMMRRSPDISWKYIHQIEEACRGAVHNPGHLAIAELERRMDRAWVLTQNVDGFHRSAGSQNLIEIHGNLRHLRCTACDHREAVEDYSSLRIPPECSRCEGLVRPEVVLFGELLPAEAVRALHRELAHGFDLILAIGTSAAFPYIAGPVVEAARLGLPTVEINPGDSPLSPIFAHRLTTRAEPALTAILESYLDRTGR